MRKYCFLILLLLITAPISAQKTKEIKELEGRHELLRKAIAETDQLLTKAKKAVGSQLNALTTLTGQITERKKYISTVQKDIDVVDKELNQLRRELARLQSELKECKQKYEASALYIYRNKSIQDKLMFIFSAKNLAQSYRRMRYVQEYATYQRLQGNEIMKKEAQVKSKQNELAQVLASKKAMLKSYEEEKLALDKQEKEKRTLLASLQKQQKGYQNEVAKKRREANQLNARIDKLIAEEIERERKRAAEEARKLAAAEKKKGGTSSKTNTSSKSGSSASGETKSSSSTAAANVKLSSVFNQNRGKLQRPVLGSSVIISHYGQYAVEGLRNVKLDNKGIDIQAQPGARACAIFDGKVTAVFQLNGLYNVLIRHGAYISVYCNLSSVSVSNGDNVTTRQPIGVIYSNKSDNNRTVLHFQLRNEKEKLNPEPWFSR